MVEEGGGGKQWLRRQYNNNDKIMERALSGEPSQAGTFQKQTNPNDSPQKHFYFYF